MSQMERVNWTVQHMTSTYCIPATPAARRMVPAVQGRHDLNISKAYARWIEGFGSIRELMHNWYDQVLAVLGGEPSGIYDGSLDQN